MQALTQKNWWDPDLYRQKLPFRKARLKTIRRIRRFFEEQDFTEVDTPALQVSPGLEVHLKAFQTELDEPFGQDEQTRYLHTSPEFTMKKLLTAGLERIFQIAHVYRNEERGRTHHPEFTMLEWYRAGATYSAMMDDTEALVKACAEALGVSKLQFNGRTADPFCPWCRLTVQDAFLNYTGIDVLATIPEKVSMEPDPSLLRREAEKIGIWMSPADRWEDIFFRIMLEKIEPKLGDDIPVILCEYPTCLGALARKKPEDERVVERFEAYICGVELCNAFSELTDPVEQEARFVYDMSVKEKLYKERYPIDTDFLAALQHGMPAAAGNAIGVDRLAMLLTGADRIEDVLWAPVV